MLQTEFSTGISVGMLMKLKIIIYVRLKNVLLI